MIMTSGTNLLPTHDVFKIKTFIFKPTFFNRIFKIQKRKQNTNVISLNPFFLIGRIIFITNKKTIIVLVEAQGGAIELPFINAIKPTI